MILLGLLIGGPSTAFLIWAFDGPLIHQHRRVKVVLHGFYERLGYFVGSIAGYAFWIALFSSPIWIWILASR